MTVRSIQCQHCGSVEKHTVVEHDGCAATGGDCDMGPYGPPMKCDIPARTLPPCDLEWGHEGAMHANHGDGFYARDYDAEHRTRQTQRETGER